MYPDHPLRPPLCAAAGLLLAAVATSGCRNKAQASNPTKPATAVAVKVDALTGMSRGGKPYFVKGAGGSEHLAPLAARGANSIRTWNTSNLGATLDQADHLGLTVSAGIWLESECGWFSYQKPECCDKQAERVRQEVMRYRDHPALLAWGLGNEAEGDGTNQAYWRQIDRLAQLVHQLDPAHPTFTAIASMSPAKAAGMNEHAPHLDYVGINTYGGAFSVRQQLARLGWKRPWLLTEWGPRGHWECPKSASGAPLEQTSSEKAEMIRRVDHASISPEGGCLGSYVFLWGWKYEATTTWYGIYTHEGDTTAVADALQELWTGNRPDNRAPDIKELRGVPKSSVSPGSTYDAGVQASDPDGDALVWEWAVLPELQARTLVRKLPMPMPLEGAIVQASGEHVSVKAPARPGIYRLHVWVKDGKGHAATANAPFEVR